MRRTNRAELTGDERRAPEARLLLCLLGSFRLLHAGEPVAVSKREATLLAALAVRGTTGAHRETLLSELWPDRERWLAGRSLHTLRWALQRRLGYILGSTPVIVCRQDTYALNTRTGIAVDVVLFEQLADEGDEQARRGDEEAATELHCQAVGLYQGDLCEGLDVAAELIVRREQLRVRFQDLLTHLATAAYQRGDVVACLELAQQLLASDPFHEGMHRLVMRCYARLGERSRALHQYQLCAALLRDEFQVPPEAATTALFDQIRSAVGGVDPNLTAT